MSCNNVTRISGETIHKKGESHTYQGQFVFTPDSYAAVTLRQTEGADSSGSRLSVIHNQQVIKRILNSLGESSKVPELSPPRGPPETEESFITV